MQNPQTFNGIYRGVVVDNDDPLRAGRVRVRVFPMFQGVVDDLLPWAIFCDSFMGGLQDVGGSFIPEIGSHVFVFFEAGDHEQPVYFGGAPAMADETPDLPSESRKNGTYPSNKVFRTKNGILVELDDTKDSERIHIKHPSGTDLEIDKDGYYVTSKGKCIFNVDAETTINGTKKISVNGEANVEVTSKGDTTVNSQGKVTVTASNSASISASSITVESTSSAVDVTASGNANITAGGNVVVSGSLIQLN